jgi:ribonuclease HII
VPAEWAALLAAERRTRAAGARLVAGVDEVGRGALAGPVVAAAVILPEDEQLLWTHLAGVRDSKQLSPPERLRLSDQIRRTALGVGIGSASALAVDALGVVRATELAMVRAVQALPQAPDCLLVDGYPLRLSRLPQRAIIRGDEQVLCIAAASIVAKVHRDSHMIALARRRPQFGFDAHKGYGTPAHLAAIAAHGATLDHRLTWAPLQPALARITA